MASPEDHDKLLVQVKRDIRSLLISAKSGLAIQDLYRDYQSLVFTTLPFRQLGFETARAFLQSIPDVCRCNVLPGGDCLVTAVADSSTAHIQKMVERQKPSQKRGATARVLASRQGVRHHSSLGSHNTDSFKRPTSTEAFNPSPDAAPTQYRRPPPVTEQRSEEVPARVAARLARLLLAREEGVSVEQLEELHDTAAPDDPLDWAGRGYRSCADLLLHMPNIARVVNSSRGLITYPSRALLEADKESKVVEGRRPSRHEGASPVKHVDSDRRPSPTGASSESPDTASRPAGADSRSSTTSSGRKKSLLASISKTVQAIVDKHPNGLLCSNLSKEYQTQTGKELAFVELGYHSVLDLVSRMPVRVIKSNAFGDWLLFPRSQPLPDFINDQTNADDGLMQQADDDDGRLLQAKERIRDILLSFPDGLRMSSLQDHYQMNCNERLPYAALGFVSLDAFVLHLTGDVLHVKYTQDGLKLYPIVPGRPDQSVTRALYPEDSVGPGRTFERVKLPDVPIGQYNLEILVAEVYHPHKFWFQLVGEGHAEALEKLMDAMELTYCTTLSCKYRMQEATVRVGQVCACPYGEQGYHRAVITAVRPPPEPVKVFYVDYGSVGTVSRDLLRFLPEEFFQLPAQALLGRLADIQPAEAEGWSREASTTFLSLVDNNRILYAMVLERSPSCVSLCLCDTNGDKDLHINDQLVEIGYAVFNNQTVDVDDKAVEELSRPVSVTAGLNAVTAPLPPTIDARSVSPELMAGRDTPSDIDRILKETWGPGSAAAASAPVSTPSRPPGFSGVLSPQAPGSGTDFTNMLTQSALLSNLQMMQLQNLMNPMMNPMYAALLMSQATSGKTAGPAPAGASTTAAVVLDPPVTDSITTAAVTADTTALATAATTTTAAATTTATSVAPAATAPAMIGVSAAVSGNSPEVVAAPSSVSSGQEASGVCITTPLQASSTASCREIEEDDIAQMDAELGHLDIQRRFTKQISVPDGVIHLICLDGEGYMVSAEISNFLWTRDILHTMLVMKQITLPHRSVDVESHQELFAELVRYNVPGVLHEEDLVDPLTLYPITCVPRVFTTFKNMKSTRDVKATIEKIIAEFDPSEPYWTSAHEEDEEEAELTGLCSASEVGGGGGALSPVHQAADVDCSPPAVAASRPAGEPLSGAGSVGPAAAAVETPRAETDKDGGGLLPEMRAILAQLQNKRRRKVEATMVGLQGTDFSLEDVIGEDLHRLDAQIASFQRRIDALTAGSEAGQGCFRRSASSSHTTSVSMNPDAPEFYHRDEEPGRAHDDARSCPPEEEPVPAPRPRVPVALRAPDGTPVHISELVGRAQPAVSGGAAAGTLPRQPVDLRTPDGRPVQLPTQPASAPAAAMTRWPPAPDPTVCPVDVASQQQLATRLPQMTAPPPATFQQLPRFGLSAQYAQQPANLTPQQQAPLQHMLQAQVPPHPTPASQQQTPQWLRPIAQQPTYGMVYSPYPAYQTYMAQPGPFVRPPQPLGYSPPAFDVYQLASAPYPRSPNAAAAAPAPAHSAS